MATRWVQAVGDFSNGGKIVLWERDDLHPSGEIFIGDDKPIEVGETAAVMERIRIGVLKTVDAPVEVEKPKVGRPKAGE